MKYFISWVAILILLTLCFPMCFFFTNGVFDEKNKGDKDLKIGVYFVGENVVKQIEAEEYILGVLMAEMPAEFELEALKAQCVAARTYLYEKMYTNPNAKEHKGGVICTDSAHCQAYISEKEAKKRWGKNASIYFEKCKKAVKKTEGIIAQYEDKPIKAVFHAFAGGKTENAEDVWGGDVKYLKSVDSPGDLTAPKFLSSYTVGIENFRETMAKEYGCDFSEELIGNVTYTQGGAVDKIKIGDKLIDGTKMRQTFGLRSSSFTLKTEGDNVIFEVKGYGHGVGMSQYGANYCAKEGMTYDEILKKYYTGIDLVNVNKKGE